MANTSSAKKTVRKIVSRTNCNKARRSRVRTFTRKVEEAIVSGDVVLVKAAFEAAQSELARSVSKGVIHANAASRKVSRFAKRIKVLSGCVT